MPAPAPIWRGTTLLVVQPESGRITGGDRIRRTDVLRGPYSLCFLSQPARGAFGTASWLLGAMPDGGALNRAAYVCNQSSVESERGGIGKLTVEWEAGGAYAAAVHPLPVGNFACKPMELYPKIERNKFFQDPVPITTETIGKVYQAIYAETHQGRYTGLNGINAIANATQKQLALKLKEKLERGEETYYLSGWRYTYEVFSYTPLAMSRGGITGTPAGPLAGTLPAGVSWLRLADDLDSAGVAGSMYKYMITWIGGPDGYFDPDLYDGRS